MTAHDPRRVRMNHSDGSYHCVVHGLLTPADVTATLARAGMSSENIERAKAHPLLTWGLTRTFFTVIELLVQRFGPVKCEPVA